MYRIIAIGLMALSLLLAILGFNKISQSTESVKVLGLEIEASDNSEKEQGYLFIGLAVVLFGGGIYTLKNSKK